MKKTLILTALTLLIAFTAISADAGISLSRADRIADTATDIITSVSRKSQEQPTFAEAYMAGDLRGAIAAVIPGESAAGDTASTAAARWIELLLGAIPVAAIITVGAGMSPRTNIFHR